MLGLFGDVLYARLKGREQGHTVAHGGFVQQDALTVGQVAGCVVGGSHHIAGEKEVDVMVGRHETVVPEVLLAAHDAFLRHQVRIGAPQAARTGAAVEVHQHLTLAAFHQHFLHAIHGGTGVILPEVYLHAPDAGGLPGIECLGDIG